MYVTKNKISYQDAAFPMYFFHLLSLTNLKLHGRKGGVAARWHLEGSQNLKLVPSIQGF